MGLERLVIIDRTTVQEAKHELADVVKAIQQQLDVDFAPVWGVQRTTLHILDRTEPLPHDNPWLVLLDDSDVANALGFHDVTAHGLPVGKVFIKSALDDGTSWTVDLSHEVLELLADPGCDRLIMSGNKLYCMEVCDACEDDRFGYIINGVLVSDFVTPYFFMPYVINQSPPPKFDCTGHIMRPFELLVGGYMQYYDMMTNRWEQDENFARTAKLRPVRGSRREVHRIPQPKRLISS
jgi:hypothetical protein